MVECPSCGFKNTAGVVFCGKCGKPLPVSVVKERKSYADNLTSIILMLIVTVFGIVVVWLVLDFLSQHM